MKTRSWRWILYPLLGAIVGFISGAIVAVNVVITAGIDRGYEAGISEVFAENPFVGVLVLMILVAGPIAGTVVALRLRRNRDAE